MQQLDAITLKALAGELRTLLCASQEPGSAKISKVQHPSAHEFLLTFWGGPSRPSHLNLFYIQLNPEAPFCVLTNIKHRQETALHQFDKPTALCMLLRKHLNGANLLNVTTLPAERVLNLVFENFNELGNRVRLVLSLELMGKHSNMLLYDEVQGCILAVAHGVSEVMSSYRELSAGLPYAPPPRPTEKVRLSELTLTDFITLWAQKPPEDSPSHFLNANVQGLGLRMLEDVLENLPDQAGLTINPDAVASALYHQLNGLDNETAVLHPAISMDGKQFTLLSGKAVNLGWRPVKAADGAPVNQMVSDYFIGHLQTNRIKRRCAQLETLLTQQQKKLNRREKELIPISDAEISQLQDIGDRILAALSAREIPPGSTPQSEGAHSGSITLSHYEDDRPWVIEINPALSWIDNAQLYYRRAKKAKSRGEIYDQMAEAIRYEQAYLNDLKLLVSQADTLAELDEIAKEMNEASLAKKTLKTDSLNFSKKYLKKQKHVKKKDVKTEEASRGVVWLHSSDGLDILVGKSSHGNDAIVGKLSRSDDWWFHVHQMPGSHVLIKSGPVQPSEKALLEAAMLAAYYSSARYGLNVPVIFTQSKFVRKIPQSYPGHVNYRNEKTIFITPDEQTIAQLLQNHNPG